MFTFKTNITLSNFFPKFKVLAFLSPIMFVKPIQFGNQKILLAFNFSAYILHYIWCIFPLVPTTSSPHGNLVAQMFYLSVYPFPRMPSIYLDGSKPPTSLTLKTSTFSIVRSIRIGAQQRC